MRVFFEFFMSCMMLLVALPSFACGNQVVNRYISNVSYLPTKLLCQEKTKYLKIDIDSGANTEKKYLNTISLEIADSEGKVITRYSMTKNNSGSNLWFGACVSESYLDKSIIEFYLTKKVEKKQIVDGNITHSLSLKSEKEICSLNMFVKHT